MAIKVRFDKDGWYHPAFGRLGRGDKDAGKIYALPDMFGERETVKVALRDAQTKRLTGETREYERFRFLPRTATVLDDDEIDELREEAEENGEAPPQVVRPKQDPAADLPKATAGAGRGPKAQSAVEKTTGQKPSARRSATK